MKIRHQLPVYSPITIRASLLAITQALRLRADPRPRLRALLEREYGAKSVLLCGSGTQALTIAIREARKRVDRAAPVALPAFSCFDVATAAVGADAAIMLYDLDPDTLAPDVESLERTLRAGARVVVIAPLYGLPVDWSELTTLADRYNAILIEDAAQGNGATWRGRALGSLGELAVLSFGRGKGWTGGGGGAVLRRSSPGSPNDNLPDASFRRETAIAVALTAQWCLARPEAYRIPRMIPGLGLGDTVYREPARETSITKAAADALLATTGYTKGEQQARRANAKTLLASIRDNARVRVISVHPEGCAGYLRLPVRLHGGMGACRSPSRALALGIAPSYPRSLAQLPQIAARREGTEASLHGAQTLVDELITLPTHSRLEPDDIARLIEELRA